MHARAPSACLCLAPVSPVSWAVRHAVFHVARLQSKVRRFSPAVGDRLSGSSERAACGQDACLHQHMLSATLLCHSLVLPSHQPLRQARPRQQQPPLMGGGTKQPRPTEPFDPAAHPPAVNSLPAEAVLPRLVVFDLDNTLWTPELYTLRSFSGYADASPPNPVAGKDVWLLDGAAAALHELAFHERWRDTKVAAASRTNKPRWARALLQEFGVPGCTEAAPRKLADLIPFQEIYTGACAPLRLTSPSPQDPRSARHDAPPCARTQATRWRTSHP